MSRAGRQESQPTPAGSVRILGIRIDDITMDETIAAIEGMIERGGHHQIITANPEHVVAAQSQRPFRAALEAADIATADGAGLLHAARWRGRPLRERVTGVDLTERIAAESARRAGTGQPWRLFLLGAGPGVAAGAAHVLGHRYPGVEIAGVWAGSPRQADLPEIAARIRAARPEIALVAYGSPTQELWIRRHGPSIGVPVWIGVGGTFDDLVGIRPRAPGLLRRTGMEWLYRLARHPSRWRRIANAVLVFGWAAWREARRERACNQ